MNEQLSNGEPGASLATEATASRAMDLSCGGHVEIVERANGSVIRLSSAEGRGVVTIQFTDRGPLVTLNAADVEIVAARTLRLDSEELVVSAGQARFDVAGDLTQRVGGEARLHVRHNYELKSAAFDLEAVRGSGSLRANDDVNVKGERVRMNCDDPPIPVSMDEFYARRAVAALTRG